jgi:outer membrane protein assembly factor BamB
VSPERPLPTTWSRTENLAWTAPLSGNGTSSPIVWGDLVIVTSQVGGSARVGRGAHPLLSRDDTTLSAREAALGRDDTSPGPIAFVVEAFDLGSGRRRWEYRVAAAGRLPEVHEKHNLATPTPATDGKRIYAWFGNGQLVALDLEGRLVWSRHLGLELGAFRTTWGHGSSPALRGQLLYLLCDHLDQSYLLALDAETGKERWKADRGRNRVSHSTPVIVEGARGAELIVNSSERVDAYDPATGALLWHMGTARQTPIPSPVSDAGMIFFTRGYRNSDYLAVRSGGRGDVSNTHVAWHAPSGGSYVPSIVHYDGLLYLTNEVGVVTCADAKTGETVWRLRLPGVFFASPVAGDGKVYFTSETGETFVLEAGRTAKLMATNDLGERFLASPAIGRGRIVLRADGRLFAIGR